MRTYLNMLTASLLLTGALAAQQATFNNTGGTVTLGTDFVITGSNVSTPSGTYSFTCPATPIPPGTYSAEWVCTGGTVDIVSFDGLTSVAGTITAGTLTETASGGGRGGHTTYYYSFSGTFTGTMTLNGQPQAIRGVTSQALAGSTTPLGTGTIYSGITNVNAAYEPIYFTDTYNYRVVRMDNMNGDNWTAVGTYGSGVKQFQLPWGISVDAAGKIYVTDSASCRVIRMDDMSGANWTALGQCGSGSLQFNSPTGVFVDPSGQIYVADTGNNRVVRVSDIAGDNWTILGGQYSQPEAIAVDPAGKIYVGDNGNARIVRVDNITGANPLTFGSSGSGTNQFASTNAISLDATGKIYVADTYNNRIVRIDDMTGANWTTLGGNTTYQLINPYGVGVDPFGTIFIADSRDYRLVMADDMSGSAWTIYGTGGTGIGQVDSPSSILALPPASPLAVPTLSATSLTFTDTVVGTPSAAQTVTMANIGSAPLLINSILPAGDFAQTNTCGGTLTAGQSCVITVTFTPTAGGARTGSVTLNLGSTGSKTIRLAGLGSLVSVTPTTLNFGNVNAGFRPVSMKVTVANPGAATAGISSIVLKSGPVYRLINGCPASLAPAATCTLTVRFSPQAAKIYPASLTITDASGTAQKVTITGTGVSN